MGAPEDVESLVVELSHTTKYAALYPAVLRRIAAWALCRYPVKMATKEAKRKLHQVFGSYIEGDIQLSKSTDDVLGLLAQHASTNERLGYYEQIFPAIWAIAGVPDRILDVACGLNPLARVQMGLSSECEIMGCEIDSRLVSLVNHVSQSQNWAGNCVWADALSELPTGQFDVALVLKTLPCMEQQCKGGALQLLRSIHARHIVVSYPIRSLGGRNKGMLENYREQFHRLMSQCDYEVTELVFPNELFFVLASEGR